MIKQLRKTSFLATAFSLFSFIFINQTQACTGHDVIINNITITSITSEPTYYSYAYTYQIKNIGTAAIALNQIVLQNYVSANATFEQANDQAGGGSFIAINSTQSLAAGATYTGTYEIVAGSNYPVSSHPYFITEVYLNSETECDITNNSYSGLIQVTTTGLSPAHIAHATINWNADTKSFTVKEWSGGNASALQYSVFTPSGTVLFKGNTTEGQSTPLSSLPNGMYIIYLTDGEKLYSNKIIY